MEQSFQTRSNIDDELPKLEFPKVELTWPRTSNNHTYAFKTGVDPDTTKAEAPFNRQAYESWTRSNHAVQRTLGDEDMSEFELFKQWELKALDGAVREVALLDSGNTEGGGEARDPASWQRKMKIVVAVP